jgi:hypothetical protein
MLCPLATISLLALAASADASSTLDEVPPRWQLSVSAATATPMVLPKGLALGAALETQRRLSAAPLFLSARAAWTAASAANVEWIIDHNQLMAALGFGTLAQLGAGQVWAQAGAGIAGVYEVLSRHQLERIQMAGVPGGSETSLSFGPYGFAEVGVAVKMRGPVSGFLAGGPAVTRAQVAGNGVVRWGGFARVGVACEF